MITPRWDYYLGHCRRSPCPESLLGSFNQGSYLEAPNSYELLRQRAEILTELAGHSLAAGTAGYEVSCRDLSGACTSTYKYL